MTRCTVCGDALPDDVPGVTTCRAWADCFAARRGGLLTEREAADLLLLRFFCRWAEALQQGNDSIGEP